MLKNSLVFILTDDLDDEVCDFVKKTCICLARNDNDVVLINTSNSLSIKEIFTQYIKNKKRYWYFIREYNGYYQVSPLLLLPFRRFRKIFKLNLSISIIFIYLLFILRSNKKYSKKIAWIFFIKFNYLVSTFKFLNFHIHFDIIDFFTSLNFVKNNNLLKAKKYLLEKADTVSAISDTLKNQYKKIYNRNIVVVPQGFGIDHFKKYRSLRIKKKKPVIGFIGGIGSRIDIDLMSNLAKNNPQWDFLFVGPKKIDTNISIQKKFDRKIDIFLSAKNVFWIDSLPKKYVASIVDFFDVSIIPYDIKYDFNKFCFPMKLFEYLYMKKPIVSTPIHELKRFENFVCLGRNYQEWTINIKNILIQLKNQKNDMNSYRELALENTWKKKIAAISKHIMMSMC